MLCAELEILYDASKEDQVYQTKENKQYKKSGLLLQH